MASPETRILKEIVRSKFLTGGIAPSVRELKARLDMSSESVVDYYLKKKLAKAGKIILSGTKARSIKLPQELWLPGPELFERFVIEGLNLEAREKLQAKLQRYVDILRG